MRWGQRIAARLSGIHVNRTRLLAFILAGLTASIAGVLTTARLDSGSPNYGVGTELDAIARGDWRSQHDRGQGNIISTLFGALTVAVVRNGLNLNACHLRAGDHAGSIIVLAVGIDMWRLRSANAQLN